MAFRYDLYHNLTIFCFEFYLNSLSDAVEASQNCTNAMITKKRLYSERCHFLALAGILYKYDQFHTTLGGSTYLLQSSYQINRNDLTEGKFVKLMPMQETFIRGRVELTLTPVQTFDGFLTLIRERILP